MRAHETTVVVVRFQNDNVTGWPHYEPIVSRGRILDPVKDILNAAVVDAATTDSKTRLANVAGGTITRFYDGSMADVWDRVADAAHEIVRILPQGRFVQYRHGFERDALEPGVIFEGGVDFVRHVHLDHAHKMRAANVMAHGTEWVLYFPQPFPPLFGTEAPSVNELPPPPTVESFTAT